MKTLHTAWCERGQIKLSQKCEKCDPFARHTFQENNFRAIARIRSDFMKIVFFYDRTHRMLGQSPAQS